MKILGIDYGEKKIGVALSDESGTMAFPHSVLLNDNDFLETLALLIEAENARKIIIGESRNYDGEENPIMKKVHRFARDLRRRVECDIVFEPEILSTKEAQHGQEDVKIVDASAAAIILQSYLDKHGNSD